jgi:hypothetical protein
VQEQKSDLVVPPYPVLPRAIVWWDPTTTVASIEQTNQPAAIGQLARPHLQATQRAIRRGCAEPHADRRVGSKPQHWCCCCLMVVVVVVVVVVCVSVCMRVL